MVLREKNKLLYNLIVNMSTNGYIKLHRKILDNGVFENGELLKVFVWCILRANTKPNTVFGRKLKVGQFVTGRVSASQELRIPPTTLYDRIKKLESMKYIHIDSGTKNSVITVLNYNKYQVNDEIKPKRNLERVTEHFSAKVMEYANEYTESLLQGFISYWTEPNRSGTKVKYELQPTFEIKRRLKTWYNNQKQFSHKEDKQNIFDSWQEARNIINR